MRIAVSVALFACWLSSAISVADESTAPEATPAATLPTASAPLDVAALASATRASIVIIETTHRDGRQSGIGTGFVVGEDGLIATNLHVIGEYRPIRVRTSSGVELEVAEIYATDRGLDLAVLRVKAERLQPLQLADPAAVPPQGTTVVAIGNPQGLNHSVVQGVVSAVRDVDGRQMIQVAIPIEPGNSGGPLLDAQGQVQGIVTLKSAVSENLGFAVMANDLRLLLERPNPIPLSRWLTIGRLDPRQWSPRMGAIWQRRAGQIVVHGQGQGFGGRSLLIARQPPPERPCEMGVTVRLDDESGAAGLIFCSDDGDRHYGFYPTAGKLRLTRFDGPNVFTWTILADVHSTHYRPGDWNRLKVRLDADAIHCFVNDHLVIESRDRGLASGNVGLAKFRHTTAAFKDFQVAKQLPDTTPSEEVRGRIEKLLEALPDAAEVEPEQLDSLVAEGPAARHLLESRARSLEEQAEQLRRVAEDVHLRATISQLVEVFAAPEGEIDLGRGALLVAQLDEPQLDTAAYLASLDAMASELAESLAEDQSSTDRLAAVLDFLFHQNGFHGSRTDYYHRANSYLHRVLDDREGLPITLAILTMELGRRLDIPLEGVGLPGHFVIRHTGADESGELIDVFNGGVRLDRDAAAAQVLDTAGIPLVEEHLRAATKREMIERVIRNLLNLAERDQNPAGLRRYLEALVALNPQSLQYRGMRAIARFQAGYRNAALADLDWMLAQQPQDTQRRTIESLRQRILQDNAR